MIDMRFEELTLASILLGLIIEEMNYTITIPWGSFSVLIGCHYILRDITSGLWELTKIMIDQWFLMSVSWNYFNPLKEVSMILWWRSWYISLLNKIEPMELHNKRFNLELI